MVTWLHTHLPRLKSGGTPDVISVKVPGQRVEYASWVSLRDAEFRIHEKGRRRCLEYGVRNVHAWVIGEEILRVSGQDWTRKPGAGFRQAVYDPWQGPAFVDAETLTAVWSSPWVIMQGKDVWYSPAEAQGYWQCAWCGQANPNHSNICNKCGGPK